MRGLVTFFRTFLRSNDASIRSIEEKALIFRRSRSATFTEVEHCWHCGTPLTCGESLCLECIEVKEPKASGVVKIE